MSTVFGQMNLAASYGETVIGIGATTYTPSINGATEFRSANVTDRLFVIGNATDANNNDVVDLAERRDAFVILKNGNAGIGTSTPLEKLHVIGNIRMADGNQAAGKVLTSDSNGTATWQNSSTTAWGLLGNTGTISTTNFIGTTDNQDLVFRRNNTISGRLGVSNSSFGVNALDSNTIGLSNTANGVNSLTSNTAGSGNTAIGFSALTANISGLSNTAVGELALASNGGNGNTAVGATTLASNTIGFENTAIGYNALSSNTSGVRNTANGREALVANSTGSLNTAMGSSALIQNTIGDSNTAIGTPSLLSNSTGDFNTALGSDSDVAVGNLVNASAIGARAEVGGNSMVLGSINGVNGATSSVNVGIGVTIPTRKLHIEENTTSTTVGQLYLQQSGTGDAFMHIGNTAGRHFNLGLDTSEDKFKIGTSATTATAVTTGTLLTIQGTGEVGIGTITPDRKFEVSGLAVQYGRISSTTASDVGLELKRVGSDWQMRNDTGEIIFAQSGDDLVTVTDVFRIGGGSVTPAVDNVVSLGQLARRWTSVFAVNGVIQTSDANDKKQMTSLTYGLDKIKQLRPISFQWKDNSIDNSSIHLGFVAQEVQQVLPEVIVDSDWIALQESSEKVWQKSERLGMKYAEIIPVIVKAIQEQQVIIEQKQEENNQLRAQLEVQNNKLIIIMQRLENLENKP
ncbi:MAG: tail fiber domain-containing protein [Flavobacterium sp.]|nr:tail fiber domain-containing protein [Flavobacterium sp.]